ncbi:MAG: hypothetical protein AB197_00965 [Parcubacteria bacterium C7867-002]|nr:MAG: hypothetical protein AB197_00965 [Parcubacteria bacterium C7867-002]
MAKDNSTTEEILKKLFVSESSKYGDKYIEHLLEQYKIYINAAEKISDRRQITNDFFLALNSGLVALLGFIATKTAQNETMLLLALASIAGITMCYFWYRIIASYKGLNDAKYKVVHMIEARLPLALYDTEWEMLGRGNDKEKYWPFSHIELKVPWIFIIIYAALLLSALPWTYILKFFCF